MNFLESLRVELHKSPELSNEESVRKQEDVLTLQNMMEFNRQGLERHRASLRVLRAAAEINAPEWEVLDLDKDYTHAKVKNNGAIGWIQVELLCKGENPFLQVRKGVA